TTFITLLPVVSLLLYGGSTLKDFAFALLVGIASGAYSSIFIAAPLLTTWKEREPEYRRRIGSVDSSGPSVGRAQVAAEPTETPATEEEAPAAAEPEPVAAGSAERQVNDAKRERRRQRRRTRPHGRAR